MGRELKKRTFRFTRPNVSFYNFATFRFADYTYAFEDSHLSKLIMPIVPPSCPESAFKGVDMTALTLMVPKKAHDSDWIDSVFGKLKIEDMDE